MSDLMIGRAGELGLTPSDTTRFLLREWNRKPALAVPCFYQWQFLDAPDDHGTDSCVVLADKAGTIFGFMGLNHRPFNLQGRSVPAAELTTWVISDAVRGQGWGKKMLAYLQARYDVLVGIGVSEAALPPYLDAGFKHVKAIPRYFRVLRPDAVRPIAVTTQLGEREVARHVPMPSGQQGRPIAFAEADRAVTALHRDFNCYTREPRFLEWRYARHPVFSYQAFEVREGAATAVVVLREDRRPDLVLLHVVEVFGDEPALRAAARFAQDHGLAIGADLVDVYCTSERIGSAFWIEGWFSTLNDPWVQVPHLFSPVEMRTPATTSVIYWGAEHAKQVFDLSRLYITKGDCDFDRPTVQYMETKGMTT